MNGSSYMGLVAQLPCCVCGVLPVEVHHKRAGVGGGARSSDYDTMPLCPDHHRGSQGFHGLGTKRFPVVYGMTELQMIASTILALGLTPEMIVDWKQAEVRKSTKRSSKNSGGRSKQPKEIKTTSTVAEKKSTSMVATKKLTWPSRKLQSRGAFPTGVRKLASRNDLRKIA